MQSIPILLLPFPFGVVLSSSLDRIVILTDISIFLEDLPEPLQKLKVVLVLALDEFLNIDVPLSLEFGETLLQNFKIVDILVLIFSLEVDFTQGDDIGIEHIHKLAVDSPCTQLLYFGKVGLKQFVDPVEELTPGEFDGVVGVYGNFVYH